MSIIYMGYAPTADEPQIIITDDPCAAGCGWQETITHWYADDTFSQGCAGCETEHRSRAPQSDDSEIGDTGA